MATAKRLYLYAVSGVGLLLGLMGAVILLRTIFNNLGAGVQGKAAAATRDSDWMMLATGIGLVVAGLGLWLVHWTLTERKVLGEGEPMLTERRSIVRSFYLAVVSGILLLVAAQAWIDLIAKVIADLLDAPSSGGSILDALGGAASLVGTVPGTAAVAQMSGDDWTLAVAIVATAAWAFHVWIRDRDIRQTVLISGSAAWISRFYLYGAALVGVVTAVGAIATIINLFLDAVAGTQTGDKWWLRPAVVAVVTLLVWGAIFLVHWWYSLRLRAADTQQGAAERTSRTRLAFMALVVFWGTATAVAGCGTAIGQLLVWIVGNLPQGEDAWHAFLTPALVVIPAAIAAWYFATRAVAEDAAGPVGVSAVRVILYTVALVGLWYLVVGAYELLNAILQAIFVEGADAKTPASLGIGKAVVGGALWVWAWMTVQRRLVADRNGERLTSSRSYYMYLVIGAAAVVVAVSASTIISQYLQALLTRAPQLGTIVSAALAAIVVAGITLAAHVYQLLDDQNATPRGSRPRAARVAAPTATARGAAPAAKAPAKPAPKAPAKPAPKAPAKASTAKAPAKAAPAQAPAKPAAKAPAKAPARRTAPKK